MTETADSQMPLGCLYFVKSSIPCGGPCAGWRDQIVTTILLHDTLLVNGRALRSMETSQIYSIINTAAL